VIAVAKGEEEVPEEAMVDEVGETREELDELDAMREVVEEAKVDEPIVEFWQAAKAAIPNTLDKIEVLILMMTTS
jgi:P2-related tail formation protein